VDWFDAKRDMLEKAWRKYIETRDSYIKAVGACTLQAFPAGFEAGWEAAKKTYKVEPPKEEG
jgi:hypothetical protein